MKCLKFSIYLLLFVFAISYSYANNNIFYLRQSGAVKDSRFFNILNGANKTTHWDANFVTDNPDEEVFFVETGDFNGDGRDDIFYIKSMSDNPGWYKHVALDGVSGIELWNYEEWNVVKHVVVGDFIDETVGGVTYRNTDDICFVRESGDTDNFLSIRNGTSGGAEWGHFFNDNKEVISIVAGDFLKDSRYDEIYYIYNDYEQNVRKEGLLGETAGRQFWERDFENYPGIWGDILFVKKGRFESLDEDNVVYVRKSGNLDTRYMNVINFSNDSCSTVWDQNLIENDDTKEIHFFEIGDLGR